MNQGGFGPGYGGNQQAPSHATAAPQGRWKKILGAGVGGFFLLCVGCGVLGALLPKPPPGRVAEASAAPSAAVAPAPAAAPAPTPAAGPTQPPTATPTPAAAPAAATGWAALAERLERGETVDAAACDAVLEALGTSAYDPRQWPVLVCAFAGGGDAADGAALVVLRLASADTEIPRERRAFVTQALTHLADHPDVIAGDALQRHLLDVSKAEVEQSLGSLQSLKSVCSTCGRRPAYREALERLRWRAENYPIQIRDKRTLQLRYADLKGQPVRLRGNVSANTYYNCRFSSQSTWRSMSFTDGLLDFQPMHVYCRRGEDYCESLFQSAISGSVSIEAILVYPRSNSVCEESQAELTGYRQ